MPTIAKRHHESTLATEQEFRDRLLANAHLRPATATTKTGKEGDVPTLNRHRAALS
jgi:hypothetical protein